MITLMGISDHCRGSGNSSAHWSSNPLLLAKEQELVGQLLVGCVDMQDLAQLPCLRNRFTVARQ